MADVITEKVVVPQPPTAAVDRPMEFADFSISQHYINGRPVRTVRILARPLLDDNSNYLGGDESVFEYGWADAPRELIRDTNPASPTFGTDILEPLQDRHVIGADARSLFAILRVNRAAIAADPLFTAAEKTAITNMLNRWETRLGKPIDGLDFRSLIKAMRAAANIRARAAKP